MNRIKHLMWVILLTAVVLIIALASSYTKTYHYMEGITYIQDSAYKIKE